MNENSEEPIVYPQLPLEKMLEEMIELLQFTVEKIDKPTYIVEGFDVAHKLQSLSKQITEFEKSMLPIEAVASSGIDGVPKQEKELLDQCKQLALGIGEKIETIREKEREAIQKKTMTTPMLIETVDEAADRRQRGIKRIGRSQKWKHL